MCYFFYKYVRALLTYNRQTDSKDKSLPRNNFSTSH